MLTDPQQSHTRQFLPGTTLWLVLFLAFALAAFAVAFETAMHFTGVAIDGPFQLYDALRRIEAGFHPGVQFQFFHGLGIPYLHYWLYRLLGGGLRGSELARELISTTAYPLVYLFFFRAFTGRWRDAFCLAAAALAASYLLRLSAIFFALNSLLGVRSTLPTLLPAILFLAPDRRWRTVLAGLGIGTAMFLSTEQGLAVLLAYLIVSIVAIARSAERRSQLVEAAAAIALAVVTLVCWLVIAGGISGMRGALRYNFTLVPMDQYWFFGAPPNTFVSSWGTGLRMLFAVPPIGLAVLLGLLACALYLTRLWRAPDGAPGQRNFVLAILSVYGVISLASLLGVYTGAYAQPCWRTIVIIVLLEGHRLAVSADVRRARAPWLGVPRAIAVVALVLSAWAFLTIRLIPVSLGVSLPHIVADHLAGSERFSIAGIWPETLRDDQQIMNAHRGPNGAPPSVWSTYSGWLEARNGLFNPSFDYIIHALGPANRARYVATFEATRPTLVQTVRPSYTQYEAWLENTNWDFYSALLRSYTLAATTPWSFFWTRRTTPGPAPALVAAANVPPGLPSIQLPPIPPAMQSPVTLLEVDIEYDVHNPLRALPIIGASPRYLVGIEGAITRMPISLDPYVHRERFPLVIRAGQQPTLIFQTFSLLPGASWTPRALRVFVQPVDAGSQPWLAELVGAIGAER